MFKRIIALTWYRYMYRYRYRYRYRLILMIYYCLAPMRKTV